MILEEFYLDFLKKNKKSYLFYVLTLIYIPISRVGIPHFYGKLIGNINDKKIRKGFFVLIILIILVCNTSDSYWIEYIAWRFIKIAEYFRLRMIDNIF